jgi:glycosyltransferase involved in cell wall biosynthesis
MQNLDAWISVVIPALNEEGSIRKVVETYVSHSLVKEVIVVDNNSTDQTSSEATLGGAKVIICKTPGAGAAMAMGIDTAQTNWIFKCDGDVKNAKSEWIDLLSESVTQRTGLVKSYWFDPEDDMAVTNLVANPTLKLFIPELSSIKSAISGIYLISKKHLLNAQLYNDYSFDLQVLIQVYLLGGEINEVNIGELHHRPKKSAQYSGMALEIFSYMLEVHGPKSHENVYVFTNSFSSSFLWAGGTILSYLLAGANVTIIHSCLEDHDLKLLNYFKKFSLFSEIISSEMTTSHSFKEWLNDADIVIADWFYLNDFKSLDYHLASNIEDYPLIYLSGDQNAISGQFTSHPSKSIDISNIATLKHQIANNFVFEDKQKETRIAIVSDELNGLRCGGQYAELFFQLPTPFTKSSISLR